MGPPTGSGSGTGPGGSGATPLPPTGGNGTGGASGDCKCGLAQRSTRIVGGVETEVNEWPWQAGMVWSGSSSVFCGATVISDEWILTASHCVDGTNPAEIQVLLGEHDYWDSGESSMTRMDISRSSCTRTTTATLSIRTSLCSRWPESWTGPRTRTFDRHACQALVLVTMTSGCPQSQAGERPRLVAPPAMCSSRSTSR